MKRVTAFVAAISLPLAASADPFPNADPQAGRKIFEEAKCNSCHISKMGGDGNRIFTRPDRRVRSAEALVKQVRFCVDQTGARIFPEDIEHVAAYLNQQFYKFK